MKSLNAKTNISIFTNLRYLRLKLLKTIENNKKICDIFYHNFKNIYVILTAFRAIRHISPEPKVRAIYDKSYCPEGSQYYYY